MAKVFAIVIVVLACAGSHRLEERSASLTGESAPKALAPLWVGPAFSGTWYAPERSGEGFTLQILDNGTVLALWFTYPPAGGAAEQAWIYAQDGRIEGDRVRFDASFTTRGPRFGAAFDASQTRLVPWGTLEFRFASCNDGEVTYAGPAGWGSGTQRLTRLTALAELECGGKRRLGAQGARLLDGLRQRSGLWYDPSHDGEGWVIEELPDGRTQFFWFTYDERGEQAWTIGVSAVSGDRLVVDSQRPVGTSFGAAFDPARVVRSPWGTIEVDFDGCDRGALRYASSQAQFGSGTLHPARLSRLAGTACVAAVPAVPGGGAWQAAAPMPVAQSEMASASLAGMSYLAGGFGDEQGFKRYDPARDSWTILARVPAGRDHALGAAVGGDVYVTGGNANGSGDQETPGWRYVVAENRWESIAGLPWASQSGAATLGGFAYFANFSGAIYQFNPGTRTTRIIDRDASGPRDHSQLVAFQGELWLLGGRQPESSRVSIWDPASETWRAGPPMNVARAGFAAASSDALLIVAGGENLTGIVRTLSQVEAIAAGEQRWTDLPALPRSVHGVAGAIHGNSFFALGGSRVAGVAANGGDVQIYRWGPSPSPTEALRRASR
jgi:N-acetylneuraminic acid mutarotase